jgi:hypothetical protein
LEVIYKPMRHQAVSLKHSEKNPLVFDTSDAGTGKTFVRIKSFEKRRAKGGGCMMVVGCRSTLETVWKHDFKKFAPHLKVSVAHAHNRAEAFATKADVYVTNHDATKWLAQQKPAFFAKFDELAVDESPAFKHYTSGRSKAMLKIVKYFKYRRAMTATPNTNSILDVWHQVLLLDGGKRLGNMYFPFRNSVCTPTQEIERADGTIQRLRQPIWVDKDGAEEAVFSLIADITIRHKLDDCADIPANYRHTVSYTLPPKQLDAFIEVRDTQLLRIGEEGITALNAGVVAGKLLQVASGAVYSGPDKYHVIDTGRYEMVLDLAQERLHPLVLFMWKHQRDLLVAEAEKRGLKFAVFDSRTSDSERSRIVAAYQKGFYDMVFAHPKTIGHGQTLTAGTSTIWASPTHDLELFVQASSRQRRIGQTKKTETLTVLAEGTTDEWVYENVMNKNQSLSTLLELFASIFPPKKAKVVA